MFVRQVSKKESMKEWDPERTSYDPIGRVHLDYLELYRKYNYEERHSYRLDYIGEMELGEKKVAYEGSLDRLYNHDFEKFPANITYKTLCYLLRWIRSYSL